MSEEQKVYKGSYVQAEGRSREVTEALARRTCIQTFCENIGNKQHYYLRVEVQWDKSKYGDNCTVSLIVEQMHEETEHAVKVSIREKLNRNLIKTLPASWRKRFNISVE
jgi:hypothetical protein